MAPAMYKVKSHQIENGNCESNQPAIRGPGKTPGHS